VAITSGTDNASPPPISSTTMTSPVSGACIVAPSSAAAPMSAYAPAGAPGVWGAPVDAAVPVVAAEDTPRSKPAPDPYARAVSLLAARVGQPLSPGECVAIEDSHWGLVSARAAGLRTIAITHTYPASSLEEADLTIDSLDALTVATLSRI